MDDHDSVGFGSLLRRCRVTAGLTQEELAERAHLSARGISDLERGVRASPRRDTLQFLADALNLSSEDRETFTAAAHAGRMVSVVGDAPRHRSDARNGYRDSMSSTEVVVESGSGHPDKQCIGPSDGVRALEHSRELRTLVLPRWRTSPHALAAVAAALTLTIAAIGWLLGQRLAHGPSTVTSTVGLPGVFRPWGIAGSPQSGPVIHLANSLRVATDRQGNVYVTEGSALYSGTFPVDRADIVKLSSSGQLLARWGRYGRRPGEFDQPSGVAIDRQGNVYVADYGNNRIQKLSPTGYPLAVWGSYGYEPGHFDLPMGLALDAAGNVYVADFGNNRVQKLSSSGRVLAVWGNVCGTKPGQFCSPTDVAVSPSGDIAVVDFGNSRIQMLSPAGRPLAAWNAPQPPSSLTCPFALTRDAQGTIFFTNHYGTQIHELSPSGRELASWTVGNPDQPTPGLTVDAQGNLIVVSDDQLYRSSLDGRSISSVPIVSRIGPARFDRPSVVTVDRDGNVYVLTGSSNNDLQKLSPSGRMVREWGARMFGHDATYDLAGAAVDGQGNIYLSDVLNGQIIEMSAAGRPLSRWGSEGAGPGQFETPYGLAVDTRGNLYVADTGNNRVEKLSAAGRPIGQWGTFGTGPGQLEAPRAVAVDSQGNIYVADTGNGRIVKLSPSGRFLASWGALRPGRGRFRDLTSISVDRYGNVFAVDAVNDQVTELSPAGEAVARWGTKGIRLGQFLEPQSVAVDMDGNVYVADTENDRLQKLSHQVGGRA